MLRLRLWPALAAPLCMIGLSGLAAWPAAQAASPPASLNVVSWNLEWLADPTALQAANFWAECAARHHSNTLLRADLPYCDVYKKDHLLTAADYSGIKLAALRSRLAELAAQSMDVLAVQEVQNPAALQAVLPAGYRVLCFTTRPNTQNLGFAVSTRLKADASCREVRSLSLEDDPQASPSRRGLELNLQIGEQRLTVLNVHLKSRCVGGPINPAKNGHCDTLQRQAQPLEAWVEDQARSGHAFMIMGDWNRDLEAEIRGHYPARYDDSDPRSPIKEAAVVRNLWPEINDQDPPASAMELADVDRSAAAHKACHDKLDQLAVSRTLQAQLDPALLVNGRLGARLLPRPAEASDHCPLQTQLSWPKR